MEEAEKEIKNTIDKRDIVCRENVILSLKVYWAKGIDTEVPNTGPHPTNVDDHIFGVSWYHILGNYVPKSVT